MIRKSLHKVSLSQLDVMDEKFRISTQLADESLKNSIREIGLVNPPLLQLRGDQRLRIVLGFRRIQALQAISISEIDAFVVQGEPTDSELFRFALKAETSERTFSEVEISGIIHKLRKTFQITESEIVTVFFPLMGLGKNPKILELYGPLYYLEPEIQLAVDRNDLSVEVAAAIAKVEPKDRLAFFNLIQNLRLGKNRQRVFWALLTDIARIEKRNVNEILLDAEFTKIISAEKLTPNQKVELVKSELWRRRYPRYSAVESEFQQMLKEMKLPPQMSLRPPAFFEGEDFQVSFSFKNPEEFKARVKLLQRLQDSEHIQKLVALNDPIDLVLKTLPQVS